MTALVIALTVISIVLPLWGLWRLYRLAAVEAGALRNAPGASPDGTTAGEFKVLLPMLKRWVIERPAGIKADFLLIGGGVVAGGAANIIGALIAI